MSEIIIPSHLLGEEPLLASMAHGVRNVRLEGLDTRLVPLEKPLGEDPAALILSKCVRS